MNPFPHEHPFRFIPHKEFAQTVVDYAKLKGWLVHRTWNSRHSPAGEPDLRMYRPPRAVVAEVKTGHDKLTEAQTQALEIIGRCGDIEVYVWRPEDWEEIQRVLDVE